MQKFADLDLWLKKAADILSGNRIEVDGYRYTAPSLDTGDFGRKDYAQQFMWDSCFHAVMWRWFDPQMAQDELLALSSRQVQDGPDAGMIPHCNYWRGGGEWLWKHDERSSITQPPLIASAALLVYERSKDTAFLEAIYTRNGAYHDWFDRRRDPDGDNLVCLIHPWEAGGDALPRWDQAMGIDTATFTHEGGRTARHDLVHKIVEYDTDAAALARDGFFCVESMDFNAIRAADMEAMAEIASILDKPEESQGWENRVDAVREAFQRKMVIDDLPYDLSGLDEEPILQPSAGQFMTLFGGLPTPEQAERLVQELQESRFWTTFPVPTSPIDSPAYAPDLYWRGNVWPSVNWLIFRGLLRYGYDDLAADLAERSLSLIKQSDFWEYYHPETGQGLGGQTFSWTTVMLDMAATMAERE
ncbi:MAG: hypothetical protein H7175_20355 [Burkholderiales bacterium]|nr:hypothetical protein [Anaerolineae bacterium]